MKVLVTNDDGVHAAGLTTLVNHLAVDNEVWVVAPDRERSGASHAVTLHDPVTFRNLADNTYSCSGTPADCILYSLLGAIPFTPDIVISGINHGPNIGTDIVYSGTVAGARQAAFSDCAAVAVSLVTDEGEMVFDEAAGFVAGALRRFYELWKPGMFFNVNIPVGIKKGAEVVISRPARRIYNDELTGSRKIDGTVTYSLHGTPNEADIEEGTDWSAVEAGLIAVSPVNLHPLNQLGKESYHSKQFAGRF